LQAVKSFGCFKKDMWPWNAHWSIIWMAQHWWSGKISGHELLQTLNTSELYMNKMYKIINCLFGCYFMRSDICESWAMSDSFRSISVVIFDNFLSFVSCTKSVNVKFFLRHSELEKMCFRHRLSWNKASIVKRSCCTKMFLLELMKKSLEKLKVPRCLVFLWSNALQFALSFSYLIGLIESFFEVFYSLCF